MTPDRKSAIETIRTNIARDGHHLYLVSQGTSPRFAYTIGLYPKFGAELVLAGAVAYSADEVKRILNAIAGQPGTGQVRGTEIDGLGSFSLGAVDESWTRALLLGAIDFYGKPSIPALQVKPDEDHWTIDVPDLSKPRNQNTAPAWRWLDEPWTLPAPPNSTATTNMGALKGERVTEAARWEKDDWELFAGSGPDTPKEDIRVVPIGTLLGHDTSLAPVLSLPVGDALWRQADELEWHEWRRKN